MNTYWVHFGGVREVEIKGEKKEDIEDVMWTKYAIYADEITKIRLVENDDDNETERLKNDKNIE